MENFIFIKLISTFCKVTVNAINLTKITLKPSPKPKHLKSIVWYYSFYEYKEHNYKLSSKLMFSAQND